MSTVNSIGTPAITLGGPLTFSGAYSFTGTLTNTTAVTFPTSGTLTTTTDNGLFPFTAVAGTTQAAAVNNGYVIENTGATTVTLPATAAVGQRVAIVGEGAAGWILAANTGQTIKFLGQTTTSGGSLTSSSPYDCVEVCCVTANTTWVVRSCVSAGLTYA